MPAYTHVSSGTPHTINGAGALTPTGSSVVSGNRLLLLTGCRAGGATVDSGPTGWDQFAISTTNTSLAIYSRIADGTALDNPSITWSGSAYRYGWIEQFSGDVYIDNATIIDGTAATEGNSGSTTLGAAALGAPSVANCLLCLFSAKQKTSTGDGSTFTPPAAFTERRELCENGTRVAAGFASWQQTTATAHDGTDWTKNSGTNESTAVRSILIALKTGGAAPDITDVDTDENITHGELLTITGSNFGATQATYNAVVDIISGTVAVVQACSGWGSTGFTIAAADTTGLPFGAITGLRITTDYGTDTLALTHSVPSGYAYGTANVPWPVEAYSVFAGASAAVVDGDQYQYEILTNVGTSVEVFADGTFVINSDSFVHEFDVRVYDQTDETWSEWVTMVATAPDEVSIDIPVPRTSRDYVLRISPSGAVIGVWEA